MYEIEQERVSNRPPEFYDVDVLVPFAFTVEGGTLFVEDLDRNCLNTAWLSPEYSTAQRCFHDAKRLADYFAVDELIRNYERVIQDQITGRPPTMIRISLGVFDYNMPEADPDGLSLRRLTLEQIDAQLHDSVNRNVPLNLF